MKRLIVSHLLFLSPKPKETTVSADNGIYILHDARDNTWRVGYAQAIDNLDYYIQKREEALVRDLDSTPYQDWDRTFPSATAKLEDYILSIWGRPRFHTTKESALKEAAELLESMDICEYGISFIECPDIPIRWSVAFTVIQVCRHCGVEITQEDGGWVHRGGNIRCDLQATP